MADEERERGGQAPGSRSPRAAPSLRCRTFDQYPNGHQTHRMTDDKLGDPIVHRRSRWVPIYVGYGLANRPTNQRGSLPALSVGELPFHFQETIFCRASECRFSRRRSWMGKSAKVWGDSHCVLCPRRGPRTAACLQWKHNFKTDLTPSFTSSGR